MKMSDLMNQKLIKEETRKKIIKEETRKKIIKEETRKKISDTLKQKYKNDKEYIKKRKIMCASAKWRGNIGKSMKGHVTSDETRKKISLAQKGKPRWSEEEKQRIREQQLGRVQTQETKQKRKNTTMLRFPKGYKHSEEVKKRMKKRMKGIPKSKECKEKLKQYTGEKSSRWLGGKSFEPYNSDFNSKLKQQIRKRDKLTCQLCWRTQDKIKQPLVCHHIDYDKKNNIPINLILLCSKCHGMTNINRDCWENHFTMVNRIRCVYE
jgi:hypothetical protein